LNVIFPMNYSFHEILEISVSTKIAASFLKFHKSSDI
jgi:hypothetical protein